MSQEWLGDFVDLEGVATEQVAKLLTESGTEVERIIPLGAGLERVQVAEVVALERMAESDHLWLAQVRAGTSEPVQVVCGAQNLGLGALVPWAAPGTKLPDGTLLKERRIRGHLSQGMLCAPDELGLGTDREGILLLPSGECEAGEPLSRAFPPDTVYELEIQSNRGDCLCHLGVARELAAQLDRPAREPELRSRQRSGEPAAAAVAVTLADPAGCGYYTAECVEEIGPAPTPLWLRRRLLAVGARPISPIVDLGNYVMLEVGQPVHAFDWDLLGPGVGRLELGVRQARPGETLSCLDGQNRQLEPPTLVITAADLPVAIAGVIGGSATAVHSGTSRVVLEAASFDRTSIRRSSRRLNLRTEASARFERGLAPVLVPLGAARFCRLAQDLLGATVRPGPAVGGGLPPAPAAILTSGQRISRLLGMPVSAPAAEAALRRLRFQVTRQGDQLEATPDPVRTDLSIPEDLAEEVGRLLGYQQLPATLPQIPEPPSGDAGRPPAATLVADLALGAGFTEAVTVSLVPAGLAVRLPGLGSDLEPLGLGNPLSQQLGQLRLSCLPGLLRSCQLNQARGRERTKLFEVGHGFWPAAAAGDRPQEPELLGLVDHGADLDSPGALERLRQMLRLVEGLGQRLGQGEVRLEPADRLGFLAGRSVVIVVEKGVRGVAGEVDPEVAAALGLRGRALAAEVRVDGWLQDGGRSPFGRRLSKQPPLVLDLAVTVPEAAWLGPALEALAAAGIQHLESWQVLDQYHGSGLPGGRKGWTLRLTFRAPDRTLTHAEGEGLRRLVLDNLAASSAAELRRGAADG
ncbi:MAG: phenylalanine--tRNA ligase subunit beta [Candidatus Dormibacteria bacterium]